VSALVVVVAFARALVVPPLAAALVIVPSFDGGGQALAPSVGLRGAGMHGVAPAAAVVLCIPRRAPHQQGLATAVTAAAIAATIAAAVAAAALASATFTASS